MILSTSTLIRQASRLLHPPLSARKWNDAMREAREDLAMDRKQKLGRGRGGDTAPPRLSSSGFRSLATLLRQRVRADEVGSQKLFSLACPDKYMWRAFRVLEVLVN